MDEFCQLLYDGAYVVCHNMRQRGEILRYISQNGLEIGKVAQRDYCDNDPGDGDDSWIYVCTYPEHPNQASCWSSLPGKTGALGVGSDRLSLTYEDFLRYTYNPITVSANDMQILFDDMQ